MTGKSNTTATKCNAILHFLIIWSNAKPIQMGKQFFVKNQSKVAYSKRKSSASVYSNAIR